MASISRSSVVPVAPCLRPRVLQAAQPARLQSYDVLLQHVSLLRFRLVNNTFDHSKLKLVNQPVPASRCLHKRLQPLLPSRVNAQSSLAPGRYRKCGKLPLTCGRTLGVAGSVSRPIGVSRVPRCPINLYSPEIFTRPTMRVKIGDV
jgi:hypothetical protein